MKAYRYLRTLLPGRHPFAEIEGVLTHRGDDYRLVRIRLTRKEAIKLIGVLAAGLRPSEVANTLFARLP